MISKVLTHSPSIRNATGALLLLSILCLSVVFGDAALIFTSVLLVLTVLSWVCISAYVKLVSEVNEIDDSPEWVKLDKEVISVITSVS